MLRSHLPFVLCLLLSAAAAGEKTARDPLTMTMDDAKAKDWLKRWEKNITGDSRNRYCDKEMGEELGWVVSPFLDGYYYGYRATRDTKWVDRLVEWSDACIKRAVPEPDGFIGWPKDGATGTELTKDLYTDSQLGEAMMLRPMLLMSAEILKTPALKEKYGAKANEYIKLAELNFEKWNARGAWREVKDGGMWIIPSFGIDKATGKFTDGYARRATDGMSLPDNKENEIALEAIALYDATQKPLYKERAEKWWRVMKSRMTLRDGGRYFVWNYWEPGGPWDTLPGGKLKHWVGVHPNGGYYDIDAAGIVAAYAHGLVFTRGDLDRLIATNRDFMWDQKVAKASFKRIDGGEPDKRWAGGPGVLWEALVPYDETLQAVFEANHNPDGWGGLSSTPQHLADVRAAEEKRQP